MSKNKTKFTPQISKVYGKVYGKSNIQKVKKLYSDPKIYTGGIDINKWDSLTLDQQKTAIEKSWYVYFSFRDPRTGLLKKMNPIKAGNEHKEMRKRFVV